MYQVLDPEGCTKVLDAERKKSSTLGEDKSLREGMDACSGKYQ